MKFRVIIEDSNKAHEAFIDSYRLHPAIQKNLRATAKPKPNGTVHVEEVETDCPDGLPNCRNCGDPEHKAKCVELNHCKHCGIDHGVAPDSVVFKNGYKLEKL